MKKIITAGMVLLCCLALVNIPVRADVIWEPVNDFYEAHSDECEYINRYYIINGYDGQTDAYESPVSDRKVTTLSNGQGVWIYFSYTDKKGNKWGLYDDANGGVGWIPMAYMYPKYDGISFSEDYKDKIINETGDITALNSGDSIFVWPYPGAKRPDSLTVQENPVSYDSVFTDEEGGRWLHVSYYYGQRAFWVYEVDPYHANVPIREIDQTIPTPPKSIDREGSGVSTGLIIGLVLGVIVLTAVLIHVFYPKKKE